MAITPSVEGSEARVFTVITSTAAETLLSEGRVFSIINFPSEGEEVSQFRLLSPVMKSVDIEISQARVYTLVKGRIENRKLRAGAFSLDGHDLYFIRLGDTSTLVYDLTTEQWMDWNSNDLSFWRPNCAWDWISIGGMSLSNSAATNIVLGDDTFGVLWTLDPDQGYDDDPREHVSEPIVFERKVVGGIPMRMRETLKVGAVYLTADTGTPSITGADITLRTSDDNGKTWSNHGTITAEPGNYEQEFVWRSLGLVRAPGRIFEITDNGATVRLDSLEIR